MKEYLEALNGIGGGRSKVRILEVAAVEMTFERLLSPLIDVLLEEGFSVDLACANPKSKFFEGKDCRTHDVPFQREAVSISHIKAFWCIYRLIKKNKYSIVHVHTPIASAIARIAARLAGVPVVVYTAHGFYLREGMNCALRMAVIGVEKLIGNLATDWLFVQSKEDTILAKRYRFVRDEARIICIGNGVNIDKFNRDLPVERIREKLGITNSEQVVGFVGRLVREKGVIELVEAFKAMYEESRKVCLVLVGETPPSESDDDLIEDLKKYIDENGLGDRVVFTGLRDDIPELMAMMDVFVLPSYREGLPRTIIEAMASGKPVVATNISGCREEVVDGQTGYLVPVRDSKSLTRAIEKILNDFELAQRMGQAGKARAVEEYDEEEVIERQMGIFRMIASELTKEMGENE